MEPADVGHAERVRHSSTVNLSDRNQNPRAKRKRTEHKVINHGEKHIEC